MTNINFIFPEEITMSDVISRILIKNNIREESIDEEFEKLSNDKYSNSSAIIEASFNLAKKDKTDDEIFTFLKKELSISEDTIIINLINDIKNEIIPFARNITEENSANIKNFDENESEKNTEFMSELKPPIELNNILNDNKNDLPQEKKDAKKQKKKLDVFRNIDKNTEKLEKPSKKQSDTYREPIE